MQREGEGHSTYVLSLLSSQQENSLHMRTNQMPVMPSSFLLRIKYSMCQGSTRRTEFNRTGLMKQVIGFVGGVVGLFEQSTVEITDKVLEAYRNQVMMGMMMMMMMQWFQSVHLF